MSGPFVYDAKQSLFLHTLAYFQYNFINFLKTRSIYKEHFRKYLFCIFSIYILFKKNSEHIIQNLNIYTYKCLLSKLE